MTLSGVNLNTFERLQKKIKNFSAELNEVMNWHSDTAKHKRSLEIDEKKTQISNSKFKIPKKTQNILFEISDFEESSSK